MEVISNKEDMDSKAINKAIIKDMASNKATDNKVIILKAMDNKAINRAITNKVTGSKAMDSKTPVVKATIKVTDQIRKEDGDIYMIEISIIYFNFSV
jgi:hypothetical protein